MIYTIGIFYIIMVIYHILSVILLHQRWYDQIQTIALIRDIWRAVIFIIALSYHHKQIIPFVKKRKYPLGIASITWIISMLVSLRADSSLYSIAVGIKYGFMFLRILFSAAFIGYTRRKDSVHKYINLIPKIIASIIIWWLIRQMLKYIRPDFFMQIGYGAIGDFIFGQEPPIYYRTGPWGEPRLQWLFAWPNNYGYFLAAFFPLILAHYHKQKAKNHKLGRIIIIILTITSITLTLSRTALIGSVLGATLLYRNTIRQNKKILITIILSTIALIAWLSIFKWWSTREHITQKTHSLQYIIEQPLWYGLWTAWPAIHHQGNILPENYYAQIAIDIGIIGFIFLTLTCISLIYIYKKHTDTIGKPYLIWLYVLLIMGLFLHVFEDSMVNYLFFIPRWLYIWYHSKYPKTQ